METLDRTNEYQKIIKKIKRSRGIVTAVFIILAVFVLGISTPFKFEVANKILIERDGIPFIATLMIYLLLMLVYLVAYACASLPMTTSMDNEVDPQKHLTLNVALNKQPNLDHIYSSDLLYLGDFSSSLDYSNKLIANSNSRFNLIGFFNKARCEFFIGNAEALCKTVEDFCRVLSEASPKLSKKNREALEREKDLLDLLVAITRCDREKISSYKSLVCWNNSMATKCYIDYIKGVAAYTLDEQQEAIHLFMTVRENCDRTILARFAETYLEKMK